MRTIVIISFLIFASLIYLGSNDNTFSPNLLTFRELETDTAKISPISQMDISFIDDSPTLKVELMFDYVNRSDTNISSLYYALRANLLKDENTALLKDKDVDEEHFTKYDFSYIKIDGEIIQPIYKFRDLSVLKLDFEEELLPGESVPIEMGYSLKVPKSFTEFGSGNGGDFYFFSDFYPLLISPDLVNDNISPIRKYGKINNSQNEYSIRFSFPDKFTFVGNVSVKDSVSENGTAIVDLSSEKDSEIALALYKEVKVKKDGYYSDASDIRLTAFISYYRERYEQRYFDALKKGIKFLEEKIGPFPFGQLTLLDVPRTSNADMASFPGIITITPELISPLAIHEIEEKIFLQLAEQYFLHALNTDKSKELWLGRGVSGYLANKIFEQYYDSRLLYFPVSRYYPIYGLELLAYNEIPIIYTLGDYPQKTLAPLLADYYKNMTFGEISAPSNELTNDGIYQANTFTKPVLLFHSVERKIGRQNLFFILQQFYNSHNAKTAEAKTLITEINKLFPSENKFINHVYEQNYLFDYKINSLKKIASNKWEVIAERVHAGISEVDIALVTETDTLWQKWDGVSSWKKFEFITNDEVIAAEIDPLRKNVFDLNFANNSRTVSPRYWASLSITVNWFFWIQNALIVLGSVG